MLGLCACLIAVAVAYIALVSPPSQFPKGTLVQVGNGETGKDIAAALAAGHIVRSPFVFNALLRVLGSGTHIVAGRYYFKQPQNVVQIVWRMTHGHFDVTPVKVVIPEGTDTHKMALILVQAVPGFSVTDFLQEARPLEGYIFPDTYFVYPGEQPHDIIRAMQNDFDMHIKEPALANAIATFGKPLTDVVTMASLLEKEAPDTRDRQIISGILWKRLSLGMPLQVDAVFPYITGKNSSDITAKDYTLDSPYNTYIHTGLPPGPIASPGADALLAAVTPTSTPYLYYLSDKAGNFHYSATYKEQVANEAKYLR
jgi:UPF0755 protein